MAVEKKFAPKAETFFFAVYIVMLSNAFYLIFADVSDINNVARASGSLSYNVIWGSLYAILMGFIFIGLPRSMPKTWPISLAFAIISIAAYVLYGFEESSVLKLICFILTIIFGGWVAARFSNDHMFDIFFRVAVIIAIVHLLLYPFLGESRISVIYDRLQRDTILGIKPYAGLFSHKNFAATFFVQALIVGVGRIISPNGKSKLFTVFGIFLSTIIIAMSGAVSPILSGIICIYLMIIIRIYARFPLASLSIGFVGAIAAIFFIVAPDVILNLFNRESTLTGRTYLYQNWMAYFTKQPILGYGYGEAFNGQPNSVGDFLNSGTGLRYSRYLNFESGMLQALIEFGIFGGLIFFMMFYCAGRYAIRSLRDSSIDYRLLPLGVFTYCLASSLNEVPIIVGNTVTLFFISYLFAKWFYGQSGLVIPSTTGSREAIDSTTAAPRVPLRSRRQQSNPQKPDLTE